MVYVESWFRTRGDDGESGGDLVQSMCERMLNGQKPTLLIGCSKFAEYWSSYANCQAKSIL